MSDDERPRGHDGDRDSRRERRGGRDNERSNTGSERRKRSRSPRQDGPGYRSRSPFRRDGREGGGGRGSRGRGERSDGGRNNDRGAPTGPRSGAGARGAPPNASRPGPKAVKADAFDEDEYECKDVVMKEERAKPEGMDDDTWAMAQVMGFAGFKSTKNTKVPGNDKNFGVRKDKQMEARQYMNRQGGFNRPLSPGRG